MSRKERIAQQLGMPHGTAANKLRKNLLFSLLVRLQENVCFKCSELILSVDELSIEHKQPWEGRDSNLFWDLENIAYSHVGCNVPHVYHGGTPHRKIGPNGTAWCAVCRQFEPVEKFHKNKYNWNGLQSHCKEFRPDRVNSAEECHSYKVEVQGSNP